MSWKCPICKSENRDDLVRCPCGYEDVTVEVTDPGFYPRKRLSEVEVAGLFVISILKDVRKEWTAIEKELNKLCGATKITRKAEYGDLEFALAVIAIEIQALTNLCPKTQAERILAYVLQCLSTPELGSYPRDAIQEYQLAWNQSLDEGELPLNAISSILFNRLGINETVKLSGSEFKDPLILMTLTVMLVKLGGGWWKNALQQYLIVH
jgi:hypothetical protein